MLRNARVKRIENRKSTAATVLDTDGENVLIAYDEGGEGWWPISSLEAIDDVSDHGNA